MPYFHKDWDSYIRLIVYSRNLQQSFYHCLYVWRKIINVGLYNHLNLFKSIKIIQLPLPTTPVNFDGFLVLFVKLFERLLKIRTDVVKTLNRKFYPHHHLLLSTPPLYMVFTSLSFMALCTFRSTYFQLWRSVVVNMTSSSLKVSRFFLEYLCSRLDAIVNSGCANISLSFPCLFLWRFDLVNTSSSCNSQVLFPSDNSARSSATIVVFVGVKMCPWSAFVGRNVDFLSLW